MPRSAGGSALRRAPRVRGSRPAHAAGGPSGEALGLHFTVSHLTRLVAPSVFGYVAALATLSVVFWINAAMLGAGGVLSRKGSARRGKA